MHAHCWTCTPQHRRSFRLKGCSYSYQSTGAQRARGRKIPRLGGKFPGCLEPLPSVLRPRVGAGVGDLLLADMPLAGGRGLQGQGVVVHGQPLPLLGLLPPCTRGSCLHFGQSRIKRLIWEGKVDAAEIVPLRADSHLNFSRLTRFDCMKIYILPCSHYLGRGEFGGGGGSNGA